MKKEELNMPRSRISPRPERDEVLRATAGAYKEVRNKVGIDFAPLQRKTMRKWLKNEEKEGK